MEELKGKETIVDPAAAQAFSEKKFVWIQDKEMGYKQGSIVEENGENVTVDVEGQKVELKTELIEKMNPPKFEKVEDMAELSYLNEASVLHNLKQRYFSNMIYTYSGLFLVTINPYKTLPIYTDQVVKMYKNKKRNEMPPHIYAISDAAYHNMLTNNENQSLLIL